MINGNILHNHQEDYLPIVWFPLSILSFAIPGLHCSFLLYLLSSKSCMYYYYLFYLIVLWGFIQGVCFTCLFGHKNSLLANASIYCEHSEDKLHRGVLFVQRTANCILAYSLMCSMRIYINFFVTYKGRERKNEEEKE